jgi:predicted CoA-binding protein
MDDRLAKERRQAIDYLDLEEGSGSVPVLSVAERMELLRRAQRIAVVGASPKSDRHSNDVMAYLLDHGYDCVPINPKATEVLGQKCYATLEEAAGATGPFDIVDVFRKPEETVDVARSAVATGAGALWLQQGIVNWEAAQIAHDAGLAVVMDACTKIEHRRGA